MNTSWLDTTEYPFRPQYYQINGHALHYIDEGEGDILLFVHGTPSWSFDFRHVIKELRSTHRCLAIDHMGFGLSDKPEQYDYSTLQHSHTLEAFLLDKDLKDVTLVVHDFGGPIGIHVAMQHPGRFRQIVVLNSWLWSSEGDADFMRLKKVLKSPLLPVLYRWFNISPRFLLPNSFGDRKLPAPLLTQYTKPFAGRTQRSGPLAFARSLLSDQEWFQSLWNRRTSLQHIPFQFIWGMKDPVIKPHYLETFMKGFPTAEVFRLAGSGHFPQEEEPAMVAAHIRRFTEGNR